MIVLDTNVVSYMFNGDGRAEYYVERIRGRRAIISFQTLEEIWYGACAGGWGRRRTEELERHLDQYEVLWAGPELVEVCARLRSECRAAGRELHSADAWIAATAVLLKCPLASHDRDFSRVPGLDVIRSP